MLNNICYYLDTKFQEQLTFPTIQRNVQSDVLLAIGRRWLSQCQSSHPQCNQSPSSKYNWYPTRLLDVGEEGSTSWKLRVVSEDGNPSPPAAYLTLSYRWGHKPNAILLSSNIASFRRGSPVSGLPILFREFISIAWHFSIRYIWIDALCIIQDSEEDWDTEAATMHLVYSNSTCNIVASDSANPEESLFRTKDLGLILPGLIESSLFSTEPRPCYIFDKSYWDRQICNGPLHNRGWVFQERFLAPRVLYFGKNQLLWECRIQHRCEVFPNGIPIHWSDKAMDALLETSPADDPIKSGRFPMDTFSLWNDLVQKYSRCDLTYPSDKLLAMAGVAKLFQGAINEKYVAGLWSSHVLTMMDWRVYDPRPRQSTKYRAPSWSWASVDGPIRMCGLSAGAEFLVELLNAEVTTKLPDEMSTVLEGFVMLKGRLIAAVFQHVNPPFATFLTEFSQFSVQIHPDTTDIKLAENGYIRYVPFKLSYQYGENRERTPCVICLMLEEANRAPDSQIQYRRIGCFNFYGQDKINSFCFEAEIQVFKVL